MKLSKWTNDELTTKMDEIAREIKRRKNYKQEYINLQNEYEEIKKEILRRMG